MHRATPFGALRLAEARLAIAQHPRAGARGYRSPRSASIAEQNQQRQQSAEIVFAVRRQACIHKSATRSAGADAHRSQAAGTSKAAGGAAVSDANASAKASTSTSTTSDAQPTTEAPVLPLMSKPGEPQTRSEFVAENKKPLPYLSTPLGVDELPSSRPLTTEEKKERFVSQERRMKERQTLVKDASRGYYYDIHAMASHGGKTWIAPPTLIRQDKALYFPAVTGTCLADKSKKNTADLLPNKVSLVCITTTQVAEQHIKSFYSPIWKVYEHDPNFQLVQINSQENYLKAKLVSMFASSLRRQIPAAQQATYLLSHQNLSEVRNELALHNKVVGYSYLVGPEGKIRWAAGGFATDDEARALMACTDILLNRLADQIADPSSKHNMSSAMRRL